MRITRWPGRLLLAAGAAAAWLALLGGIVSPLDALASFMPLFALMIIAGALLAATDSSRIVAAAGLGLAPVILAVAHEVPGRAPNPTAGARSVSIVSHNLWHANPDLSVTVAQIERAGADIVLLQEVGERAHDAIDRRAPPYRHRTPCPSRDCGLAILSRWPIVDSGYFLEDDTGRRLGPPILWARIAIPGMTPVTVGTLHYPHPLPIGPQLRKRQSLARALARVDHEALILGGDMNLTPWSAAMRAQDADFAPLARATRALFSWPAPFPLLPIDHVYAGPAWSVVASRRLPATGSDHFPILVTLERSR